MLMSFQEALTFNYLGGGSFSPENNLVLRKTIVVSIILSLATGCGAVHSACLFLLHLFSIIRMTWRAMSDILFLFCNNNIRPCLFVRIGRFFRITKDDK